MILCRLVKKQTIMLLHVALFFVILTWADPLSSISGFIWNIDSGFNSRRSNLLQYHIAGFTLFNCCCIYAYLFFSVFFYLGPLIAELLS